MTTRYRITPTASPTELANQINRVLRGIAEQFDKVQPAVATTPVTTPSSSSLFNIGGAPGAGGGTGIPPGGTTSVTTDGTTISGDGNSTPISLVVPVALASGGTGLIQTGTQQITTNGTVIAAGTAQAQPAASIAGVTTTSAAMWSLPNVPDATWQTGIAVIVVCTAGTVTLYLVNPTAGPITPIAQLVNIKAIL